MSNLFKVVLAASLSAWFFVACNKGSGGAKVNGPKDGARAAIPAGAGANQNAEQAVAEKLKQFPTEQQQAVKTAAEVVTEIRPLFRDASQLFNEIWTIVVNDKTLKEKGLKGDALLNGERNAFNYVKQVLEKRYDKFGMPPVPADDEKAIKECKEGRATLAASKNPNIYAIQFSKECKKEVTDAGRVALLTKLDDKKGWVVTFAKEVEGVDPKDLHGNMAIAKGELTLTAKCTLKPNSIGRLESMTCEHLSQDLTKTSYGVVKSWNFSALDQISMDCGKEGKKHFCASIDIRIIGDSGKEEVVEGHLVDDPDLKILTVEFTGTISKEKQAQKDAAKAASEAKAKADAEEKARQQKEAEEKEIAAKATKGNSGVQQQEME